MAGLRGSHLGAMQDFSPLHSASVHPGLQTGAVQKPSSPSPLHSASVHISTLMDVNSSSINPQPWGPQGRGPRSSSTIRETLNQDYLSPMKLIQLTQEPDLRRVTYLELSIHTTDSSVGNFGKI